MSRGSQGLHREGRKRCHALCRSTRPGCDQLRNRQLQIVSHGSRACRGNVQHPTDIPCLRSRTILKQSDKHLPRDHEVRVCPRTAVQDSRHDFVFHFRAHDKAGQINRKHSNGGIAAKTAPMSPVAVVLCIVCLLHHQPASYLRSLRVSIVNNHPATCKRSSPTLALCLLHCRIWPHVQLIHEAHLTSRNSPIVDSIH